ncbi:MAG: histidine kinase dimerization/phosphoacceptor domain -containing protein [Deltaproteobacteria bacterium]|nr:histidine kinase dimerization/phosphoacceptor domain -containing protein [Candidatus Deferrimicrobiaceae bacterium]
MGELPWGSHFCQFYRTRKDLLEVLVPYFLAGLESNEFCIWVTSRALREEDAEKALRKAFPRFGSDATASQMEIIPFSRWQARGGKTGRAILSGIDKAVARGFDGLRLACDAVPDKAGGKGFLQCGTDAVRSNNVIAAFLYPRGSFDALGLMEVVKNHRFALVRNGDRWEVIESSEARTVKDELERSKEKLKSLFSNMSEGFAYCRIVLDSGGKPSDCTILEVNDAFERLTGIKAKTIIGKRATAVLPGIEKDASGWIAKFGYVAATGNPVQFDSYSDLLQRWYTVSAFSPHRGHFAVTFSDISERKQAEETIRHQNIVLDGIGRILQLALTSETEEGLGQAFLAIAEEVTRSEFGFIGEIGPDGFLHDLAISNPGWELCTMHDTTGHRRPPGNFQLHGLYGKVIRDGKGFFTNAPSSHPDSNGTPEGHPRLSAFLGAPLLQDGKSVGMVGMGNREGGYRTEDLDALVALANAMVQALRRKRAEKALRASLSEKEILLKELAHRTKNNMQVVGSLLSLQAVSSADDKLLEALADIQDRIRAMALVHEKLYRSGNFTSLNLKDYVTDLMASLLRTHRGADGPVRTNMDLEDIFISIDAALPCGLIINELVSNSLKHAFPGRKSGTIFLSLRRVGEKIELAYRDDGPGLPPDLDLTQTKSLGLKLVYNLAVRQLRGNLEIRHDPVAEFVITFGGLAPMERT